jgi:hypothetical protein
MDMDRGPPKYEEVVEMYDDPSGGYNKKPDPRRGHSPRHGHGNSPSASSVPLLLENDVQSLATVLADVKSAVKIVKQPTNKEYGKIHQC